MGPLLVEFSPESIEAHLLSSHRCGRRTGRLLLEGLVHALVPTVLLRVARLDELRVDA